MPILTPLGVFANRTTLCSKKRHISNILEHIKSIERVLSQQDDPDCLKLSWLDAAAWQQLYASKSSQREGSHLGKEAHSLNHCGLGRELSPDVGVADINKLDSLSLCSAAFQMASSSADFHADPEHQQQKLVLLLESRFRFYFDNATRAEEFVPQITLIRGLLGLCALLHWAGFAPECESFWRQRVQSLNVDKADLCLILEKILQYFDSSGAWITWMSMQFKLHPQWVFNRALVDIYPKYIQHCKSIDSSFALLIVSHREFSDSEWLLRYIPSLLSASSNPNLVEEWCDFLQVAHSRGYQTGSTILLDQSHLWSALMFNFADEQAIQASYMLFGIFECSYKLITSELIQACFARWQNFDRVEIMVREYRDAFGFGDAAQSVEKMNVQFSNAIWTFMFARDYSDATCSLDSMLRLAMTAAMPRGLHRDLLASLQSEKLKLICEANNYSLDHVTNMQRAWQRLQVN